MTPFLQSETSTRRRAEMQAKGDPEQPLNPGNPAATAAPVLPGRSKGEEDHKAAVDTCHPSASRRETDPSNDASSSEGDTPSEFGADLDWGIAPPLPELHSGRTLTDKTLPGENHTKNEATIPKDNAKGNEAGQTSRSGAYIFYPRKDFGPGKQCGEYIAFGPRLEDRVEHGLEARWDCESGRGRRPYQDTSIAEDVAKASNIENGATMASLRGETQGSQNGLGPSPALADAGKFVRCDKLEDQNHLLMVAHEDWMKKKGFFYPSVIPIGARKLGGEPVYPGLDDEWRNNGSAETATGRGKTEGIAPVAPSDTKPKCTMRDGLLSISSCPPPPDSGRQKKPAVSSPAPAYADAAAPSPMENKNRIERKPWPRTFRHDPRIHDAPSPYEGEAIKVRLGQHPKRDFNVPKRILDKYPSLPQPICTVHRNACWISGCSASRTLTLDRASDFIGGTFVHYLYTGEYRAPQPGSKVLIEYARGLHVYRSAVNYGLDVLAAKAQRKLLDVDQGIPVFRLLGVAALACPEVVEQSWFQEYITLRLTAMFKDNEGMLRDQMFLDRSSIDLRFIAFLAGATEQVYKDKLAAGQLQAAKQTIGLDKKDSKLEAKPEKGPPLPGPFQERNEAPRASPSERSDRASSAQSQEVTMPEGRVSASARQTVPGAEVRGKHADTSSPAVPTPLSTTDGKRNAQRKYYEWSCLHRGSAPAELRSHNCQCNRCGLIACEVCREIYIKGELVRDHSSELERCQRVIRILEYYIKLDGHY
ncbi:uncharacterized protein DSM5745_00968 [Aspergillus mulundensis]|uniref:BTB domain-containing protein n=1 Tax=Aspergillus mulundensis TaxID=1810919 RepID=A0A3D8T513_9EURO|nr:hypothetical protein DSM5745_00968 [Aspergillus mulundensis]RDW93646.1 hypothetical protein DSM5745_00968 [Aspergillus mulundensis]